MRQVRKWCREFKFLNWCQGGTDISLCLEIILKNNKIEVESAAFNIVNVTSHLISVIYGTVLMEHAL